MTFLYLTSIYFSEVNINVNYTICWSDWSIMYRSITNIQYFISTFSIKRIFCFNGIVVCSGACLQGERVPSSTLSVLPKCFVRCDCIRIKKILGNVRSPSHRLLVKRLLVLKRAENSENKRPNMLRKHKIKPLEPLLQSTT